MNKIQFSLATLAICLGFAAPAKAQTDFQFSAEAYGTYANIGRTVVAGKSAVSSLGACGTTTPPVHSENTVGTASAPPLLSTGVINTTVDGLILGDGTLQSIATANVHDVSLLEGVITADEVLAVSSTTHNNAGFQTSAAGSNFVNLTVAGIPIIVNPAPNTTIDLLGFGHVVLNEQISTIKSTTASLTVNMIHVFITQANVLNIAVGTEIIVSHAFSSLTSGIHGTLDGQAYGTKATILRLVTSGPSALVKMPCLGTRGRIKTNSIAEVVVPGLFSVGEVVDTAQGTVTATSAVGELTSTVQGAAVLTDLVTASVVKADAHASKINGTLSFSDTSTFVGLAVAGFPEINDNVAPNTQLTIAGLGTLWLHRVIQRSNSIEIRMIELSVTESNSFGLPIGTTVQVAVASASAH
ncbi:MAG: hypothetical protein H0W34_00320 [Pyrinomonadaceae bacterium]|nr:hypothetical protein [Pyrinomonadaceae bacterium]